MSTSEGKSTTSRLRKRIQSLSSELEQLTPEDYALIAEDCQKFLRPELINDPHDMARFPQENPNPVLRLGSDGTLIYNNPAAQALLGEDFAIDHPAPPFFQKLAAQASQTGQRKQVEYVFQKRTFSLDVVPIPQRGYVNIYGRDITSLKQSEATYQQLFSENLRQQALLDAIYASDPGGLAVFVGSDLRLVQVNPAYRFIIPHNQPNLIGLTYAEIWAGEDLGHYTQPLAEVLQTGRPYQTRGFERHYPDGTTRIFTLQARRIYWGEQPAVLVILWDTTEQVLSEAKYRDLAESITDNFVAYDQNMRCIYRNRASEKTTLHPAEYYLGKSFTELFPELVGSELHRAYLQVLETRQPRTMETRWIRPEDGATLYFDVNIYPTREGISVFTKDITKQKLASEALLRSEKRIATIFSGITDYCYILDPDWRFITINQPALAYFKKTRAEVIGRNFWEVFPEAKGTIIEENYHYAVREQKPIHYETLSPISGLWVEVHAYPSAEGIFAIFRDVTERRQRQEINRAMNEIQSLLHSTLEVDEVMERAVSAAAEAIGSETAALSLRDEAGWVVRYVYGFPEQIVGMRMNDDEERHAVLAIQTRQPVAIFDAEHDKRVNHAHMRKWGILSVLVVPVIQRGEVVGVLFFNYYQEKFKFQQVHIDFAIQLAATISLALENASLYQGLQKELFERKRAQQALLESEKNYRELIRYAPVGIYEVDFRKQRFTSVNDAMCQLTGYTRAELLEMNPFDLLDDESKRSFQDRIRAWLAGEKPAENVEYVVKAKDGHSIYAELNVSFTTDDRGRPVGATVIGYDVTERKQKEERILQLNQELAQRNTELALERQRWQGEK